MEIGASGLLQEMQALKVQAGTRALETLPASGQQDFSALLQQALENVNQLQGQANDLRTRLDMGDQSVDLTQVMIAGQKASIAFEATVQVRNKVVDAYKTIMNMPV